MRCEGSAGLNWPGQGPAAARRRSRKPVALLVLAAAIILVAAGAALSQTSPKGNLATSSPRLTGPKPPTKALPADPLPRWVVDDVRRMRAYPEQPPLIPHSIEGYQLSVNTNRCLSCHRREFVEGSGAPMISVTHYMTREGQMLADVSPRRYFCTACHVPQADVPPLVENTFVDMSDLGARPAGSQ